MVLPIDTATACGLHNATWLKASTLVTITDHGSSDGIAIDTPIAERQEWIGLTVLGLGNVLYVMDLTVLKLAVPAISVGLPPSSTQLLWIIDTSGFLVAGSLITMGTLGDRIGHRKLLLTGTAAFGVGSVLAAFSTSVEMLIVRRALLGLAGATLAPSTLSLILLLFQDPRQRSLAIGTWIGAFSAGGALGPAVGGLLLQLFWWGSVFLVALPVTALLLVLGPRVPAEQNSEGGWIFPARPWRWWRCWRRSTGSSRSSRTASTSCPQAAS
jgi:DHA2 family multidrug resistance protein-like MFS transporter